MMCLRPIRLTKGLSITEYPDGIEVPCGQCPHCKTQKKREWAMRVLHELDEWQDACFVTLTYDDDHLPYLRECTSYEDLEAPLPRWPTLRKDHLQKFFKRLRKNLCDRRIKYYACGEYGSQTQRPHYHVILFGVGLSAGDRQIVMDCWPYCDWSQDQIRSASFGIAEPGSIAYVAQYIDKKMYGEAAELELELMEREPVFRLLSCGLGLQYALRNMNQLQQLGYIPTRGGKVSIPRYYINKLNLDLSAIKDKIAELDAEQTYQLSNLCVTDDVYYKTQSRDDVVKHNDAKKSLRTQHNKNISAKIDMRQSKL